MVAQINKRLSRRPSPECCPGLARLLSPRLFKALCDPSRLALLALLAECGGTCTVGEAASRSTLSLSVVSRHLATLREAGVLAAERRGKEVHYSVRAPQLAQTLRAIAEAIETCCPAGRTGGATVAPPRGNRGAGRARSNPSSTKRKAHRS